MSASWTQLSFQILLLLVSCRRISAKTPGLTPTPLVPTTPLPTDVRSVILKGESHTEKIELLNPVVLSLECTWTGNQKKAPNVTGHWMKDGEELQDSRLTVALENEQYNLRRVVRVVNEESLGNYSCMFGNEAKIDFILAVPKIGDVRDKPIVSYIGDTTVITCKMEETKPKPNTWNWYKDNGTDKEQILPAADVLHYEITVMEWKTKLTVYNLSRDDSGLYYCGAVYAIGTAMSHVELKVITIMEPLKPFIAILTEVVVLVAAILLYEKSQSKKNLTTENELNDDQKDTASQEEENRSEASDSVRQRK
ncbi:embigin-like [Salarias fasciatus]|uniref:embigin-like n=1 Tax=Salarias fasciatus TaxID=181472 RepID=UPI001176D14D|nr:embigin-like [Salarias fasciatus]